MARKLGTTGNTSAQPAAGESVKKTVAPLKAATARSGTSKVVATKTRAPRPLMVPKAGAAFSRALEAARLSPDALRQYAGPAPDARYFRLDERLRGELHVPPQMRLVRAFAPDRFVRALSAKLGAQGVGFACQVNDKGARIASAQGGSARNRADGDVRWSPDTRQHIASASKFYTAVALARLLEQRGIPFTARIKAYLPVHWKTGSKAYGLTFDNLLTHRGGLWTGACDYAALKEDVAHAANAINEGSHYANGNFALMRILIPIIDRTLDRRVDYGPVLFPMLRGMTDVAWDVLTRKHFHDYMQAHIWRPGGVTFASLRSTKALWNLPPFSGFPHVTNAAIGYGYPPAPASKPGVDISADLTGCGGAVGWHVSCAEMLAAAGHIRRSNSVVSAATLKTMFDNGYGIFGTHGNDHARMQYHDGVWGDGEVNEWSYLGFVGTRHQLAVLSNNARDGEGKPSLRWLRDVVHEAFDESFR